MKFYNEVVIVNAKARQNISERDLASKANISRETLRSVLNGSESVSVENLKSVYLALGITPTVNVLFRQDTTEDVSKLVADGGDWKIHYFNLVDDFRRTKDISILSVPPSPKLSIELKALLASIVCALSHETGNTIPDWANTTIWLKYPWFVAGIENLKASGILESPIWFRRNNIFVLENFLSRV
jgi:transcriptional regulator with XRE-family HTH domain